MYELRKKKTTFLFFFSEKHRDVLRKSIWETVNETKCCASLAPWSIAVKGVNLGLVLVKEKKKKEEKCDKLSKPQLGWIKYLQKPMDNAAVIRSTVLPLSIYWVGKERKGYSDKSNTFLSYSQHCHITFSISSLFSGMTTPVLRKTCYLNWLWAVIRRHLGLIPLCKTTASLRKGFPKFSKIYLNLGKNVWFEPPNNIYSLYVAQGN